MLPALLWTALLGVTPAPPQFDGSGRSIGPPLSDRTASYVLEARLDPVARKLEGRAVLTWANRSDAPQRVLWFHAYWNAFKNARSTFARESKAWGGARSGPEDFGEQDWGWTELRGARLPDGTDLRPTLAWERPDDGNPDDQTVFTLTLPTPVAPRATVTLELSWEARVPRLVARSGVRDGFFLLGQWFPKIGVLDVPPQRGVAAPLWNCHQFHASSEFYADFGSYDAALTVPRAMVVGATGVPTGRTENPDGTVTHRFHQDDVIDFAWTAWEGFTEVHDVFRSEGLPEVGLTALVPKETPAAGRQLLEAVRTTLEYGGRHWRPYPFPQLTIVTPPIGATFPAGGMEYPTFVTGFLRTDPEQPRDMMLWEVAIHEVGHNWWQGMLASNEFEEAWLDEGITTWATATILDEQQLRWDLASFPPPALRGALRPFLSSSVPESEGFGRARLPRFRSPIARPGWTFLNYSDTAGSTYSRAAGALRLLEREVGPDTFARILRTYAERWAFRHPGTDDFLAVASEVSGRDLKPLAMQLFRGTAGVDDAVTDVRCTSSDDRAGPGLFDDGSGGHPFRPRSAPSTDVVAHRRWRCEVLVERRGDLGLPVDVRVTFEDGSVVDEHWAPGETWHRFAYERRPSEGGRVVEARVHPAGPVPIDADWVNDARSRKTTVGPVAALTGWFLYAGQLLAAALGSLL
jgi:hypothetical protein